MSAPNAHLPAAVVIIEHALRHVTDPEVREALLRATWEVEAALRGLAPPEKPQESPADRIVRMAFDAEWLPGQREKRKRERIAARPFDPQRARLAAAEAI